MATLVIAVVILKGEAQVEKGEYYSRLQLPSWVTKGQSSLLHVQDRNVHIAGHHSVAEEASGAAIHYILCIG